MTPYRTRKVRILNGAHTASVPAAFLYGLETVGEMMDHAVMGKYVRDIVYQEIVPSIALERQMVTEFADSVMERFQNPYIRHYLISILLNSASKYKARVLPSILEHYEHTGAVPARLAFSFAALIAVYKDGRIEGGAMQAQRAKGTFVMKDDLHVLAFFAACWSDYHGTQESAQAIAQRVLENGELWGQNLATLPGLVDAVGNYLFQIAAEGMQVTVDRLVGAAEDK
jgi:tagaturonate reductase